jgi:endo-beta-N-acetylglucosaminidase D
MDGENPAGALATDGAGDLYGATGGGGTYYAGTVFTLRPNGTSWQFASLYSFTGGSDGLGVSGGLILDPSGDIFGTASYGGLPTLSEGTVFELSAQ